MGRDAGRAEDPADHAERPGWLQGRGLSGRGHHTMVHCRHCRLQRVHQGEICRESANALFASCRSFNRIHSPRTGTNSLVVKVSRKVAAIVDRSQAR